MVRRLRLARMAEDLERISAVVASMLKETEPPRLPELKQLTRSDAQLVRELSEQEDEHDEPPEPSPLEERVGRIDLQSLINDLENELRLIDDGDADASERWRDNVEAAVDCLKLLKRLRQEER